MSNTRTGFGSVCQLANWLGCPTPAEYVGPATLNTKYQIQQNLGLGSNESARLLGISFGVGGLNYSTTNGRMRQVTTPHTPKDGAPFEMLPACIRSMDNDLSPAERARYGLRHVRSHNGVPYFFYYVHRHSFRDAVIKMHERSTVNGVTESENFVPAEDAGVLAPVPTVVATENVNPLAGVSLVSTARLEIRLDAFAVGELLNAAQLLFGSEDDAYVTEIQLIQAVERQVDGATAQAGVNISYTELIAAQVGHHITSRVFLPDYRDGYATAYELGGSDPMFILR